MRTTALLALLALAIGCGGVTTTPDSDAGSDAGVLAFCAGLDPAPLFCADFDGSTDLAAWTSTGVSNGTLTVEEGDSTSSPHALRAAVQPGMASAHATIALATTGLTHAHLALALRLEPSCFEGTNLNDGLVNVGTMVFGGGSYAVALFAGSEEAVVYEGTSVDGHYVPAGNIPSGAFVRVELEIELSNNPSVTTRVDGESVVSALAFAPETLDNPLVSVGLDAAIVHSTACVAPPDDVVVDGGGPSSAPRKIAGGD